MKKSLALVAVASIAAVSLWGRHRAPDARDAPVASTASDSDAAATNRLLADRVWIDHLPRNDKDTVNVFAMISKQSHGLFQATSVWRGAYELFGYEASGGELRLVFPQTGQRDTVRAKAKRCSEQGMDYCLELQGASRGVKQYYSREGWEIDGGASVEAVKQRVDALRAQLSD